MLWPIPTVLVVPGLFAARPISLYSGPIRGQNQRLESVGCQYFEGIEAARTVPAAAF